MKILHYALGFPPYRSGGLTKYCTDLMLTQKEQGNEVAMLWPGQIALFNKRLKIKQGKQWKGVGSFEIINPLPIALDEGITDVDAYTRKISKTVYKVFLERFAPDVIHIHTLMGLHSEFIDVAKNFNIRLVFTSHDYYGLCPKVTLFRNGQICEEEHECENCVECNQTALSMKKIMIMQSPLYRTLKNTAIMKAIRRKHRAKFFEQQSEEINYQESNHFVNRQDYAKLRNYYIYMLGQMDMIHFNSSVTEQVYKKYVVPKESKVISITHRDIRDHRKIKSFENPCVRFTYLGPTKAFKGCDYLIQELDKLWEQGDRNFELHSYTLLKKQRPYITIQQDGYQYGQLDNIFLDTDLLIVPSIWKETFGFTVLEAMSFGVPVLVTEHVGAKDLLYQIDEHLICNSLSTSLKEILSNTAVLTTWNEKIISSTLIKSSKQHSQEIMQLYCKGKLL